MYVQYYTTTSYKLKIIKHGKVLPLFERSGNYSMTPHVPSTPGSSAPIWETTFPQWCAWPSQRTLQCSHHSFGHCLSPHRCPQSHLAPIWGNKKTWLLFQWNVGKNALPCTTPFFVRLIAIFFISLSLLNQEIKWNERSLFRNASYCRTSHGV